MPGCSECSEIQKKWYSKLKDKGFVDIECGRDEGLLSGTASLSQHGSDQTLRYYELAWEVFRSWERMNRTRRDCLVAELFARQDGFSGTLRGISQRLKKESLSPSSKGSVQNTLSEIYKDIQILDMFYTALDDVQDQSKITATYDNYRPSLA